MGTTPFTLINARPSPFGRKVAIALLEKGIDYVTRYDLPWSGKTCTPSFSPLEQLPILVNDLDEPVYDSTYILEWLEARFPAPPLLPVETEARLAAKKRQMLGERLMEIAQSLIFELHRPDPSKAWIDRQTRKISGALGAMERLHASHRPNAAGAIDLGDIAIGTTLLLLEFVVVAGLSPAVDAFCWRGRYGELTRGLEVLETRPSFVATIPQHMDVDIRATVR